MRKTLKKITNIGILQIVRYHLPITGIVSILHRISGFVLFLFLGSLLRFLDVSLSSQNGFHTVASYWQAPVTKVVVLGFLWLFFHHLFAGIRYLLLDLQYGLDKSITRYTSAAVFVIGLLSVIFCGVVLW